MAEYPTRIIPMKLPNGAVMYFEVSQIGQVITIPSETQEENVANRRVIFENGEEDVAINTLPGIPPQDFAIVMRSIEGIADAVSVTAEKSKASELNVEFGLELGVESGQLTTLFVKGSGKANLKVSLKWTRSEKITTTPRENK